MSPRSDSPAARAAALTRQVRFRKLTNRGEAILSRMYARIAVAVEDGRIVATTTTAGGTTRRREWMARETAEGFRRSGLDAALSGMRQDAGRICDAATAAMQGGTQRASRRLPKYVGVAAVRISRTLAERLWPDREALGWELRAGRADSLL